MKLSDDLQKLLQKVYEPAAMVEMRFRGNDLAFKTDEKGRPVLLFIGRKNTDGNITGERYVRVLKTDRQGNIIKDHWDLKGKAS